MQTLTNNYELIEKGITAREEKNYALAFDLFTQAEEYPELVGVSYYEQAVTYWRLKNNICAKRLLGQAIGIDPSATPIRLFLADLLLDEENYDEAEKVAQEVLRLDPTEGYAHQVMLRCYHEEGDSEAEYNYYRDILPKFSDDLNILYNFAFFLISSSEYRDDKFLTEALEILYRAQNEGLEDESLEYHIGKTYLLMKENKKCVEHLKIFLENRRADNLTACLWVTILC